MAFAQSANLVEKVLPHEQQPITDNVANYAGDNYGDRGQLMKAVTWQGKYSVKVGRNSVAPEEPRNTF